MLLEERRTGNGDQAQWSSASSSCARGEFCGRDVVGDVSCGGPMVVSSMLCSSVA